MAKQSGTDPTVHDHRCFFLSACEFGARPLKTDLPMDMGRDRETGTASGDASSSFLTHRSKLETEAHQSLRTCIRLMRLSPPPTECNDGLDNDSDGLLDLWDPGCTSVVDTSELDEELGECANALDDDGNGLADFPHDPHCEGRGDLLERPMKSYRAVATALTTMEIVSSTFHWIGLFRPWRPRGGFARRAARVCE